jgi:hypothetical protein
MLQFRSLNRVYGYDINPQWPVAVPLNPLNLLPLSAA